MSISTKTGDDGTTSLLFGRRVSKTDLRVEACGAVDELNATLGMARAAIGPDVMSDEILRIQTDLVMLMGELALAAEDRPKYEERGGKCLGAEDPTRLTCLIDALEKQETSILKDWHMPGGTVSGASLDFARTVCRRAERAVLALPGVNPEIIRYLNRLSDLCWLWARVRDAV